jgi:hypothetical protein
MSAGLAVESCPGGVTRPHRKRRKYTLEFKAQLVAESQRPVQSRTLLSTYGIYLLGFNLSIPTIAHQRY